MSAYIKEALKAQGISINDDEISTVEGLLNTINEEEKRLDKYENIKARQPIQAFDTEVTKDD